MTKIRYDHDPFSDTALKWMSNGQAPLETIHIAEGILEKFRNVDDILTLRQLFYQFVKGGLLNNELLSRSGEGKKIYKNFGNLMTKARNNGLVSWLGIEDRDRTVNGIYRHEENDYEVVNNLEYHLSLDFWKRQDTYVEVWVEKNALIRVIAKACRPLKLPYMATKGYLSSSEAWRGGRRFMHQRNEGKQCVMLHLGDHDPEGVDMTRDNQERLLKYSEGHVDVRRIGLTMEQVEQYGPPPNYAKASSSRFDKYVSEFGEECWELDALEPSVIVDLINDAVEPFIDRNIWDEAVEEENNKRRHLKILHNHWDNVKSYMDDLEEEDFE